MSKNNTSLPPAVGTGAARPGHTRMKENKGKCLHHRGPLQASLISLDLRAVRRVGDAITLYAMRTERLEMFGHLSSQFERDTVQTRGINSFCATQRAAREKETRRIDAENAKLLATEEAKLHQNKEKLAKMAQANADMDAKYGQ